MITSRRVPVLSTVHTPLSPALSSLFPLYREISSSPMRTNSASIASSDASLDRFSRTPSLPRAASGRNSGKRRLACSFQLRRGESGQVRDQHARGRKRVADPPFKGDVADIEQRQELDGDRNPATSRVPRRGPGASCQRKQTRGPWPARRHGRPEMSDGPRHPGEHCKVRGS